MQLGETGALSRPLILHTFLLVLSSAPTSKLLFVLGKFKKILPLRISVQEFWCFKRFPAKIFLPDRVYNATDNAAC